METACSRSPIKTGSCEIIQSPEGNLARGFLPRSITTSTRSPTSEWHRSTDRILGGSKLRNVSNSASRLEINPPEVVASLLPPPRMIEQRSDGRRRIEEPWSVDNDEITLQDEEFADLRRELEENERGRWVRVDGTRRSRARKLPLSTSIALSCASLFLRPSNGRSESFACRTPAPSRERKSRNRRFIERERHRTAES